jgi:hypothetical protein
MEKALIALVLFKQQTIYLAAEEPCWCKDAPLW